ncbi:MAG: hypothetical protein CMJ18_15440 [Phycisphaeraceae bacterium]|nr:hypothetical protein [Phycisphaeraceae bacterium]
MTDAARSPRRRWRIGIALVAVSVALSVVMLPALISSPPGTSIAMQYLTGDLPGDVVVDDLALGWFSGTRIAGLEVTDPDGGTVATIETVEVPEIGLIGLVRGGMRLGPVTVEQPRFRFVRHEDGTTNLDAYLAGEPEPGPWTVSLRQLLRLAVSGGRVEIVTPDAEVTVSWTGKADVDAIGPLTVEIEGDYEQADRAGRFSFDAVVRDYADATGILTLDRAAVELVARHETRSVADAATGAPLDILIRNFVASARADRLGERLTLSAEVDGEAAPEVAGTGLRLEIDRLLGPGNALNLGSLSVKGAIDMPGAVADRLLAAEGASGEMIGDSAHLEIDVDMRTGGRVVLLTTSGVGVTLHAERADDMIEWLVQITASKLLRHCRKNRARQKVAGRGTFDPKEQVVRIEHCCLESIVSHRRPELLPRAMRQWLETYQVAAGARLMVEPGATIPLRDWRSATGSVAVRVPSASVHYNRTRVPIGVSKLDLSMAQGTLNVSTDVGAMDGKVRFDGNVELDPADYRGKFTLDVTGLQINTAMGLIAEPGGVASRTAGLIDGRVTLEGPLRRIATEAGGGGRLAVRRGILTPLPVLHDLIRFINIENPLRGFGIALNRPSESLEGPDQGEFEFTFDGDRCTFTTVDVDTRLADIKFGAGTITFAGDVDMEFSVSPFGVLGKGTQKKKGKLKLPDWIPGAVKKAPEQLVKLFELTARGPIDQVTVGKK